MKTIFFINSVPNVNAKAERKAENSMSPLRHEVWRPSLLEMKPNGLPMYPFIVWWVFHQFGIFSNKNYHIYLIYANDGSLIHRSCVFPKYFRFPFMINEDLQIGDTYTEEGYRGRGLAKIVLQNIVSNHEKFNGRLWYVVEDDNLPSIKVVEKSGFERYGVGERRSSILGSLFGKYFINQLSAEK
jgi:RimJ/RimL family protein N-acetyltransferase